tara:strand:- start:31 stop:204 length:174 start_codon:yes stop_codon:yes gene_type:complete
MFHNYWLVLRGFKTLVLFCVGVVILVTSIFGEHELGKIIAGKRVFIGNCITEVEFLL